MSDKDKTILDDNNTFPQITDIQTYVAETETRILEAFEKGSRFKPKIEMAEQFLQQHVGSKLKLVALYVEDSRTSRGPIWQRLLSGFASSPFA